MALVLRGEVPLAHRVGGVPGGISISGSSPTAGDAGVVAREAGGQLDDAAHAVGWWLRPVSTQARVGEHSAVVWKLE